MPTSVPDVLKGLNDFLVVPLHRQVWWRFASHIDRFGSLRVSFDERIDETDMPSLRRIVYWHAAEIVGHISSLRMPCNKGIDDALMSFPRCKMQRRLTLSVHHVEPGWLSSNVCKT